MSEWIAYDRIEAIGQYRREFPIAQLTSIFYNFAQSFGSKNGKRITAKPQDFMPWLDAPQKKESEEQTVEEMKRAMIALASAKTLDNEQAKEAKAVPYPHPPNWYKRRGEPVPEELREK